MRIGIDLGGTSVKAALCADDGAILIKQSVPTRTGDPDGLREDMKQLALALCEAGGVQPDEVESIGIGVPGTYDKVSCTLKVGTNLGMNDICFSQAFRPEFACAVQMDNDANCAALGEATAGAAKNIKNMLMVTLGTGVGAGIVIGGELYCGHDTGAGEIGSIPYLDRDYEYYCSSRFFVGRGTTGKEAYERAAAGDPEALALWREFGGHVGQLVMLVLYTYDPEAIVFGGSIAHAFGFFREAMYEQLKRFPYAKTVEGLHICCSNIDHVGLLGASACE